MKRNVLVIVIFFLTLFGSSVFAETPPEASDVDISYFYGYSFGDQMRSNSAMNIDSNAALRGVQDALAGHQTDLTEAQALAENQKNGAAHLTQNATKAGVKTTASGLQYRVISAGTGTAPSMDSQVTVHYSGRLIDGTEFDSSYKRNKPVSFGVAQVIAGWTEGLQLMKVGGKMELTIPADLAYGSGGTPNIPPMSVLIFEVELLDVQ